jgi:hypothetical protein
MCYYLIRRRKNGRVIFLFLCKTIKPTPPAKPNAVNKIVSTATTPLVI